MDIYVLEASFIQTKYLCVLIHIWIKGELGAPWNRFKPSSKIFYWLLKGPRRTSFVDLLCFCSVLCLLCLCLYVPCGHLLGKGWPLGSSLWSLTVSLSLSHWYPGSGVVLDCIDSWSLHPYLLSVAQTSNFLFSNWYSYKCNKLLLLDFSLTVKAAPHECVIRTSQSLASVKAEKEVWFYLKVTVSSCATTSVII